MKNTRNIVYWALIGLLLLSLVNLFQGALTPGLPQELAFSDFVGEVQDGQVREVTIQGKQITGYLGDGRQFQSYAPDDPTLVGQLLPTQTSQDPGDFFYGDTSLSFGPRGAVLNQAPIAMELAELNPSAAEAIATGVLLRLKTSRDYCDHVLSFLCSRTDSTLPHRNVA